MNNHKSLSHGNPLAFAVLCALALALAVVPADAASAQVFAVSDLSPASVEVATPASQLPGSTVATPAHRLLPTLALVPAGTEDQTRLLVTKFSAREGFGIVVQTEEPRVYCGICNYDPDDDTHWASDSWMPIGVSKGDHGWHVLENKSGECEDSHPTCGSFAALTDEVIEAVSRRDPVALASLMQSPAVRTFASRTAIQVFGCDGESVVGHVAVDISLLQAVAEVAADQLDG